VSEVRVSKAAVMVPSLPLALRPTFIRVKFSPGVGMNPFVKLRSRVPAREAVPVMRSES
jgi:hypothetical protein